MKSLHKISAPVIFLLPAFAAGCDKSEGSTPSASASQVSSAQASQSAVAPVAEGIARAPREIEKVVNPKREQPYSGPTGIVAGTVVLKGGEAPPNPQAKEIPEECLSARESYRQLFREGMLRSAPDVFVAVTGYSGYVPAKKDAVLVTGRGCAFETRTVGMTFGQALEVASKDSRAYVPELMGAHGTAQMVATPMGKPVELYPTKPGRYVLVDSMRTFARAEVLVVAYSTFDVTGMDGKFEIKGVPVGKVKLDALLPSVLINAHREITVKANETTEVELELEFDRAKWDEAAKSVEQAKKAKKPL